MSSGTVSKPQSRRREALLYLAHPAFFPGAFKSQPLLVLDSGTTSVHSMANSEYCLRDLDYNPYAENAISPDPFPSAYEFEFTRNMRLRECEVDLLSCLIPVISESLEDGCDAIQSVVSGTENERANPATARDHLPTNRYEVRKLAMEGRRRVLIQFGEDPEKPLPVPKKAVHSRVELPPHLKKRLVHRSKSHGTYFGIRRRITDHLELRNIFHFPTTAAVSTTEEAPATAATPATETTTLGLLRRGSNRVKGLFTSSKPSNGNGD
ncbi:hypothetical protein BZA77DRAFT_347443 [Pyronema omphalodes]|nr:hypothetical protein BZA77DRAFT_347443 [Pyronema omphalodes]